MADSRCFILDPLTGERLVFQHAPAQIKDDRDANFKEASIPGSHGPKITPSSGGRRAIQFLLDWVVEDDEDRTPTWVVRQIQFLQSLTYPRIVNQELGLKKITPVLLVLGTLLELPVFVRKVSGVYGPFQDADMGPIVCRVNLSFQEEIDTSEFISAVSARQGAAMIRTLSTVEGSIQFSSLPSL